MNLPNLTRPNWMQQAACRGLDPNLFIAERGDTDTIRNAKAICKTCPVKTECLEYGLEEKHGIWGGLAEKQRRQIRQQRARQAGRRNYVTHPIAHGTPGGFDTHRRRGEQPCPECVEAKRIQRSIQKQRQKQAS